MPYIAVTSVNLEGRDPAAGEQFLRDVLVPQIKALPGFLSGRFVRSLDGTSGTGAVMFDTEANATAGLAAMANRPAEAPPVVSTAVNEVILEI
ncbi:MAG: hypothetical protein ACYDH6_13300 [Acidimicrobiales bacterium]